MLKPTSVRLFVLALAAAAIVGACGALGTPMILKDADGLRTFPLPDVQASCSQIAALDPVHGTLHGEPGATDQAWLVSAEGDHLSIVWPQGFTVRFDPVFALIDDQGRIAARAADDITLPQIPTSAAAGSYGDPYFASGSLFSGCYPRRSSSHGRAA